MGFYEFIKSLDIFGVQLHFHIKSQKTYTSFCGGLIFLIYAILCTIYILINLISFINRTNISVIHYSKEIFETDELIFNAETSSFAIGLDCDKYDDIYGKLEELFDLQFNYITRIKTNGTSVKTKYTIPLHKCSYEDFPKISKKDLDENKITTEYYCPNEKNHTIKGIITNDDFRFYELILVSNNDSKKDIYKDLINKYDCKFNFYYTDISIDVANMSHPVDYYLNNLFIQLIYIYFKKVNIFFNIETFNDDQNLFLSYPEKTKFLTYVQTEQYENYHGENRYDTKYEDYRKYAKYFIKADKTTTIVERKCRKFPEFVASLTSILSGIFLFLNCVTDWMDYSFATKSIIDTFCVEQKEILKKLILVKNKLVQEQQFNDKQDSGIIGKFDSSKIKINPFSQINTLDELNKKSIEIKSNNYNIHNNYNINNFYVDLKRNNFININTDGKNNEKIETDSQVSKEIKIENSSKFSILNYIIKESIIKFYFSKIFFLCKKRQKKVITNYKIFIEKSLEQLITRLDIINYLKRIDQLETLFQILFKSPDFYCFNIFSKFNMNNVEGGIFHVFNNYRDKIYTEKFTNYYNQILNYPEKTIIEERLVNLIQKAMKEI